MLPHTPEHSSFPEQSLHGSVSPQHPLLPNHWALVCTTPLKKMQPQSGEAGCPVVLVHRPLSHNLGLPLSVLGLILFEDVVGERNINNGRDV